MERARGRARDCPQGSRPVNLFPRNNPERWDECFSVEETEAQSISETCPRLCSVGVGQVVRHRREWPSSVCCSLVSSFLSAALETSTARQHDLYLPPEVRRSTD